VIGMGLGTRGSRAGLSSARVSLAAGLVLALVVACQPSAPPGFTGSVPPDGGASGAAGPSLVAGKPTVTLDGAKVMVAGLGSGKSADFDLPAGSAQMTVSVCASNQVIPFVTLYDAKDNKLGIIVEPSYQLTNLVGGSYYLDVVTNPSCVWTIQISPG
jgi:hypothetical protein